MRMMSERQICT